MVTSDTLNIMCWEGYETPALTAPFEQRHKIKIKANTLLSDALVADDLLSAEHLDVDVLNINNAYIRDKLYPHGLIKSLDKDRFEHYQQNIHPIYSPLLTWSYGLDNALIGIGQRFGPFNLVVNSHAISVSSARDQGFDLANDTASRFGILDYPDFNVFHMCIGAGLNPFSHLDETQIASFGNVALDWCRRARLITDDHHELNQALIDGDIDFYISGGIYTASPARLAGHINVCSIVPDRGPIDGNGGIVFSEITSILRHDNVSSHAESFLAYLLEPETAVRIAFVDGTCNPVAQMGDPQVFGAFSVPQLNAIQWDDLEEDLDRCSHYQIPPNNSQLLDMLAKAKQQAQPQI